LYGVEIPRDLQPAVDAFLENYRQTRSLDVAKKAFWTKAQEIYLANPVSHGVTNPQNVKQMGLEKFLNGNGYMDPLFQRIAHASDLGMTVKAIDAPMATILPHADAVEAATSDAAVKGIVGHRNGMMAGALRPGMVAEVGAFHTGGAGSIENLSTRAGLPAVSFDVYGSKFNKALDFERAGVPVLNKAPGWGFLKGLIGGM
jgi:hypothetical protein